MPANTNLVLANPDFNSIEGSLKQFLRSQDRFKDYDFEGSNLATLVNLLAYNTYQNAFLANMAASEMFMDTAQTRGSVVSHAKELGYTPRSTRSAVATLSIIVDPDTQPGVIIMPRGTLFNTQVGSRSYTFATDRSYTILPINGVYRIDGVEVFEGFSVTERYIVTPDSRQRFVISNPRVDTRSLIVKVDGVTYKNATSVLDLNSSSQVFFLEQRHDGQYEIRFGADIVGNQPVAAQEVLATYSVSVGADANGARVFRPSGAIDGHTNIQIVTSAAAYGGSDAEDIESIRRNAPLLYQTRNRAVTTDDYKILLKQEFPSIQAINVYGGETVSPPQYGRVLISIDTASADGVSNGAKSAFYRFIKNKCPITIEPVFTDPTYMYLKLKTNVYFDYANYSVSAEDINTAVIAATQLYNQTALANFDVTFMYSNFIRAVDNAHPAILSNDTEVQMILSLDSEITPKQVQTLEYHNELDTGNVVRAITSSSFMYKGKTCQIHDDGQGGLRIVTNATTTPVSLLNIGSVDYKNGIIRVNPFEPEIIFGYGIRLYAIPQNKNIAAVNNVLLSIDTSEVDISAVPTKK